MGLRAARLECDDCGKRFVSGRDTSEDSASGLVRVARREWGWERIGTAWLCGACAGKFRRLDEAAKSAGRTVEGV